MIYFYNMCDITYVTGPCVDLVHFNARTQNVADLFPMKVNSQRVWVDARAIANQADRWILRHGMLYMFPTAICNSCKKIWKKNFFTTPKNIQVSGHLSETCLWTSPHIHINQRVPMKKKTLSVVTRMAEPKKRVP